MNVSAKDLGTGKEQRITITASTNMSKEDVEKAVKDAEQLAFQTEMALGEMGEKIDASVKAECET